MKKSDWLIAIIRGAKGKSAESGRDYIIFDGKGFFDAKGIPLQINSHNRDLSLLDDFGVEDEN